MRPAASAATAANAVFSADVPVFGSERCVDGDEQPAPGDVLSVVALGDCVPQGGEPAGVDKHPVEHISPGCGPSVVGAAVVTPVEGGEEVAGVDVVEESGGGVVEGVTVEGVGAGSVVDAETVVDEVGGDVVDGVLLMVVVVAGVQPVGRCSTACSPLSNDTGTSFTPAGIGIDPPRAMFPYGVCATPVFAGTFGYTTRNTPSTHAGSVCQAEA